MIQTNIYFVYKHIRLDTNETFYIGKGKGGRAFSTNNRNKYWHNIVNLSGYTVEIIKDNLLHEDAIKIEIELIKLYGRKDLGLGTLVNMTDGGEGKGAHIKTEKERNDISERMKNKKYWKGRRHSEVTKKVMSEKAKGRIMSEETRKKISIARTGSKRSQEFRENRSRINKERTLSDLSKEKMKELCRKMSIKISRKVIDVLTGEIYDSVKAASKAVNMNYSTLSCQLKGRSKSKTTLKYLDN